MQGLRRIGFAGLAGWDDDDHEAALAAYRLTEDLLPPEWPRYVSGGAEPFFRGSFVPVVNGDPPALLTGYYEPEVEGRARPENGFCHPLYAPPIDLPSEERWFSRAEIEKGALLAGRELVWLATAIEAFLAQVQGSVRVRLPDGSCRRFGFAAANRHPYRSIGAELIARGEIAEPAMSAAAIREWCGAHPGEVATLLGTNPSFVFFRRLDLPDGCGPLGAMGRPVTADRTVAVDPAFTPLGAPVWTETAAGGLLAVAQDTGSAIKGPQRADLFCGSGPEAGLRAGAMRETGRIVTLMPRALAEEVAA